MSKRARVDDRDREHVGVRGGRPAVGDALVHRHVEAVGFSEAREARPAGILDDHGRQAEVEGRQVECLGDVGFGDRRHGVGW